jgi:hypothetical protein
MLLDLRWGLAAATAKAATAFLVGVASERLMGIGEWVAWPALLGLQLREKLARRSAEQGRFPFAVSKLQLLACLF